MSSLLLRGVRVVYDARPALDIEHLDIGVGETVALVGPSGAGKTTLLRLANGTLQPSEGTVIRQADPSRTGTVYQQLDLVGPLRVVHNVNAGHLGRWSTWTALRSLVRPAEVAAARSALAAVGIEDKLFSRTDHLSGGEQQRVALARVLVQDAELIVADEPVSSLDPTRSADVMELFTRVARSGGRTLLVSLHDFSLARMYCQRVIGLRDGRVVFDSLADAVTDEMGHALYEHA
jgi:phosphonate transport system ATP-binding protein